MCNQKFALYVNTLNPYGYRIICFYIISCQFININQYPWKCYYITQTVMACYRKTATSIHRWMHINIEYFVPILYSINLLISTNILKNINILLKQSWHATERLREISIAECILISNILSRCYIPSIYWYQLISVKISIYSYYSSSHGMLPKYPQQNSY
jgi:hypothetical protein